MKKKRAQQELFDYMELFDDPEAPDGAWQAMLEDAVRQYNEEHGTSYDPYESWLAYTQRHEN